MTLNIELILRWDAMNVEQNEGCFINIYQEEDLRLESDGTWGSMHHPFSSGELL